MGSLNLKIEIDPNAGFCFGVVNAINKAEKFLESGTDLYCIGELVHNEEEIKRLEKKGLITVNKDGLLKLHNRRILFRAHGEPPVSYEMAKKGNNEIIDATCPIIISLQGKLRRSFQNNESIYIFGEKNHPEIIGLNGHINNKAVVFESFEELDTQNLPGKITLYSQTTKSIDVFNDIVNKLKNAGIEVNVQDSVCRQVSNRKNELIAFSRKFDKILFVAGKNSSNGKVLYHICVTANKNSHFICSPSEISTGWFNVNDSIGISGATSTPAWLMNDVSEYLQNL